VCYLRHMRVHINLDEGLIAELDRRAGRGRRSAFIARTLERALEDERRWQEIEASLGAIADRGHEWDADPAAWVQAGRREDSRRVG
jgi:Arc/MetJ family transcription regulator